MLQSLFCSIFSAVNATSQRAKTFLLGYCGFGKAFADISYKRRLRLFYCSKVQILPRGGRRSERLPNLGWARPRCGILRTGGKWGFKKARQALGLPCGGGKIAALASDMSTKISQWSSLPRCGVWDVLKSYHLRPGMLQSGELKAVRALQVGTTFVVGALPTTPHKPRMRLTTIDITNNPNPSQRRTDKLFVLLLFPMVINFYVVRLLLNCITLCGTLFCGKCVSFRVCVASSCRHSANGTYCNGKE